MIKELINLTKSKELLNIANSIEKLESNTTIFVNDSQISPLLASAIKKPFVYVALSRDGVEHASTIFKNCGLTVAVVSIAPDFPIYSENNTADHLSSTLLKFIGGSVDVLVIAATCLLSCVPRGNSGSLDILVGQKISIKDIAQTLEKFGYSRVQTISSTGEFSIRGDVIDFFGEGDESPIRMMFFGHEVEAIKRINIETFLSTEKLHKTKIAPITNVANISAEFIGKRLNEIKSTQDNIKQILKSLMTRVEKFENIGGIRWVQPFICEFESVLSALVSRSFAIIFDRPREILDFLRTSEKQNIARMTSLIEGGLLLPEHAKVFNDVSTIIRELEFFTCIGFQNLNSSHELFKSKQTLELKTLPVTNYFSAISILIPDLIRNVERGKKVFVFVGKSRALENYLQSKGVSSDGITIIYQSLGLSFELVGDKAVIYSLTPPKVHTEENVFQKSSSTFIMPKVGEVIVHEHHGLGRYLGIKKLTLQDAERDYIVLQYDGGAFVYLPPEQTGLLSNYVGEPTRLNRIGGQDFANAKQRVRRRLRELSFKLSELYAKRARANANTYECDETVIAEFVRTFPYKLTLDQEKAIRDIDADMRENKVMDRLICGDVGYGKTEVALNAAFRAIMSGYQVALLCPTTILSVQHLNTARSRLGQFGIRVEVLNRFVPDSQVEKILKDVESGSVDMLVGTHRLLSKDVKFENLSLLILDEEQRFGVGHKEKIKRIKSNIDVLTLSATPIPRTLNMALIGIRDISNIQTAPVNRHPIITYVIEYSDALISDAIHREKERGGQILVLFNNVEYIETFTARLRKLVDKDVKIAFAHGQMSDRTLEETITSMYNREVDVLVASTIIENGIDISTANTLIVIDSDYLGVAQMHQLRGRVGRSNIQAFAYFTYSANKEISEIARERLLAIQNHSGAGAGMNIALRDLQLRGAGDLLGASQSGHMEQIGFDMYCKILAEVSAETRRGDILSPENSELQAGEETSPLPETVLDISLDCYIPQTYIEHEDERIKVYRAISQINIEADCDKILSHLNDLYGKIPTPVKNVVLIGYVRALAKNKNIKHIKLNKHDCVISFFEGSNTAKHLEPNMSNLIAFLSKLS